MFNFLNGQNFFSPKFNLKLRLPFASTWPLGLLVIHLALINSHAVNCDIIASASVRITKIVTTYTSAAISWNDGHVNGDRYFCYDSRPPLSCPNLAVTRKTTKVEIMTNLTPRTKYYYRFYGVWGRFRSTTSGTFITDSSTCMETSTSQIVGFVTDGSGDSLEHVIVNLTKTSTGEIISSDTTERFGSYFIRAIPGSYNLSFTYPPFTSPKPDSVNIISGKSLWPGVKKLTGAFQVGGFVVSSPSKFIEGATITAVSTTDPANRTTTLSDIEGHYNLGLKPGSYTLMASYKGTGLPTPLPIKVVDKALKISDLILNGTVKLMPIFSRNNVDACFTSNRPSFLANGVQLPGKNRSAKSRLFNPKWSHLPELNR